jgi:hypothetical protein
MEVRTMSEFDVWTDDDGNVTATKAVARFVDDADAPYGYCHHVIRVDAPNNRNAKAQYRAQK